jgi:hypothetical protein
VSNTAGSASARISNFSLNYVPYGRFHSSLEALRLQLSCSYTRGRWLGIRVLVAFEDQYRSYREVIAAAIRVLRPQVEVSTTDLDGLEAQVARLNPRVVISSQEVPTGLRPGVTWFEVPLEVGPWTQPTMETLLEAIDAAENLPTRSPKVERRS